MLGCQTSHAGKLDRLQERTRVLYIFSEASNLDHILLAVWSLQSVHITSPLRRALHHVCFTGSSDRRKDSPILSDTYSREQEGRRQMVKAGARSLAQRRGEELITQQPRALMAPHFVAYIVNHCGRKTVCIRVRC